jgi:hypothetical protein
MKSSSDNLANTFQSNVRFGDERGNLRLTAGKKLLITLGHLLVRLLAVFKYFSRSDVRFVITAILLL